MADESDAVLLRIYVKESDQKEGTPLHEVIVDEARKAGLAGATSFRGIAGYGSSSAPAKSVSSEAPVIIEIIDWKTNVKPFISNLKMIMDRGLITTESVDVAWYQSKK